MSDNASRNIETGPGGAGRPVTLTELLTVPRRRWRWLAAFAVLGVVAVAGYLTVFPASYTATAEVAVRPVVDDPFSYPSAGADRAVNMTVESGIATGTKVASAVAAATHRGVPQVRDALAVEVPVDSQILRFEYTAGSARQAVTGANAAAHGYLTVRRAGYRQQRDALLASYDTTLAGLNKKLSKAQRAAQYSTSASDSVRSLDDQIAAVTEERATIAAIDLRPGTLTRPAAGPVPSSHDSAPLYLLAGALGGALLGALAAFGRESADRRVRSDADARAGTGAPLLGVVRHGARATTRAHRADVEHVAIAIGRLAADRPVMLLSARTDEHRTELAADLAVALAAAGETVYLGDVLGSGDELHTLVLGNPAARPRPTAAPVPVAQQNELDETVQFPAVTLAAVGSEHAVPVRPVNGRPLPVRPAVESADLTDSGGSSGSGGGDALARLPVPVVAVGEGRVSVGPAAGYPAAGDTAPLVLLDAPALELDARGLRALGDAVPVLVAARHRTRLRELRRAADRLDAAGTAPAGVVLVGGHRG